MNKQQIQSVPTAVFKPGDPAKVRRGGMIHWPVAILWWGTNKNISYVYSDWHMQAAATDIISHFRFKESRTQLNQGKEEIFRGLIVISAAGSTTRRVIFLN